LLVSPKPPARHVVGLPQECLENGRHAGAIQSQFRDLALARLQTIGGLRGRLLELAAILLPRRRYPPEQGLELLGRQIHGAQQRVALGGQKYVEGPARVSARGPNEGVEVIVEGRLELSVHHHRNEFRIQQIRDARVTEALATHHVAPVTRKVSNG
jgi:hypothetical protein